MSLWAFFFPQRTLLCLKCELCYMRAWMHLLVCMRARMCVCGIIVCIIAAVCGEQLEKSSCGSSEAGTESVVDSAGKDASPRPGPAQPSCFGLHFKQTSRLVEKLFRALEEANLDLVMKLKFTNNTLSLFICSVVLSCFWLCSYVLVQSFPTGNNKITKLHNGRTKWVIDQIKSWK